MERSKMRKIQRSTKSSDDNNNKSESENIPLELVIEILSRLPAKSIVRFSSVSKLWSSVTTTPDFINSFMTRSSSSSRACVVLIFRRYHRLYFFSSPLDQNTYSQVENFEFTIPYPSKIRRYESVHGLIYLETCTQLMIRNPIMKRFFSLPNLEGKYKTGFLGYDPISGKYKALCILEEDNKIGILTLGAQESWRIVSKGFLSHYHVTGCAQCINGVIYYEGGWRQERAVVRFDLSYEKFSFIKFPTKNDICFWVSYEGRLALVSSNYSGVEYWILENAENHQWMYKHFHAPLMATTWKLNGVTAAGEFVYNYMPPITYSCRVYSYKTRLRDCLRFMYFDPRRQSKNLREVLHGGITVEDIRRLDQVGYNVRKDITVIPNHIESLMSL